MLARVALRISIATIGVATLLPACSRQSAASRPSADQAAPADVVTVPKDLTGVEITLERTECFGWCPSYTVTINAGGSVCYIGRRHVREQGQRESTISEAEFRALFERFVRSGFFSIVESYEPQTDDDAPITYLTVKMNGRVKCLANSWAPGADDFPPERTEEWKAHTVLNMLAHSIDRAVNIEHWIGRSEERRNLR